MYVSSLGSVSSSSARELQTTLKNLGYLSSADVDGVIGNRTMTAILSLGRHALDDFAGSINAGGPSADNKTIAESHMRGVQTALNEAQAGGKFSGNYAALIRAQSKLQTGWNFWAGKGGRTTTPRATAFLSLAIPTSASGGGTAPGGGGGGSYMDPGTSGDEAPSGDILGLPPASFALAAVGVGILLLSLVLERKGK